MTKKSAAIVFFGSGPVAAASLRLLHHNFAIEAVVTKPRPAHHHGPVPVLETAAALGLPLRTAATRAALDALMAERPFQSQLAVLIDFGVIVSQRVIDYFSKGIINSHFSLLPEWRGADPITFAILSGQHQTGVSLMLLVAAMDEGPLLAQMPYPLSPTVTTPELTDGLVKLSYELLVHTVPAYLAGTVRPRPQDPTITPTYSRRLTKDDGIVDWTKPAVQLEREVRAFVDWPKSTARLAGKEVVIVEGRVDTQHHGKPGTVCVEGKQLFICCEQDALELLKLKPAGKPSMSAAAFLAGYRQSL
ncbi:MAG TPA: methionyl-tRNA formyltransferase [Chroococcales cyanobacterium]